MGSRTQFYFYLAMLMLTLASFLSNSRVKSKCTIYLNILNNFNGNSNLTLMNEKLEVVEIGPSSPQFPHGRKIRRLLFLNNHIPPTSKGTIHAVTCYNGTGTYFVSVSAYFILSTGYSNCTASSRFVFSKGEHKYQYLISMDTSPSNKPFCLLNKL